MRFLPIPATAILLLSALAGNAQPQNDSATTGCLENCGPLDDPAIYPGEIIMPAREWEDDWGGSPPEWINATGG